MELINKVRHQDYSPDASYVPPINLCSDSLSNEYVPFYSLFNADFKKVRDVRYFIYYLPEAIQHRGGSSNRITNFKSAFKYNIAPMSFLKGGRTYLIAKQIIYDFDAEHNPVPLYMLVVKKEYMYDIDFENPDPTKFLAIISHKFDSPERRLMYSMIKREIFPILEVAGIDLVFTSNIQNWCFKKAKLSFEFSTIAEMKESFNQSTKEAIYGITGTTPQQVLERRRILEQQRAEARTRSEQLMEAARNLREPVSQTINAWEGTAITATSTTDSGRYTLSIDPIRSAIAFEDDLSVPAASAFGVNIHEQLEAAIREGEIRTGYAHTEPAIAGESEAGADYYSEEGWGEDEGEPEESEPSDDYPQ